jgi:diaminohydroxyphosphoribosylaminopyrimidine deaminase / 5-amino-6-(5-phosphoribosylamino)uracil reductase
LEVLAGLMLTPTGAMKLAIHEGQKGLGFVAPNPAVGCVIVDSKGHLLAKGYHHIYGGPHAEIDALEKIKDISLLKGATFYVTLEPCAHEKKTPSCAKRLATLPIKKVVYGLVDPYSLVNGKGLDILKAAGIEVELSTGLENELEELCEVFLCNLRKNLPFVSLKVATSLDGQLAHVSGESRWISGEKSREETHRLRAHHDAILVGKETMLHDNPSLNIRHDHFKNKTNTVIILDSKGKTLSALKTSNILKTHKPENVIVAVGESHAAGLKNDLGVQILSCAQESSTGYIDLKYLMSKLYQSGTSSVLVEGGAHVLSSFLQHKVAQRFYQFIAPQIVGAKSGVSFSKNYSIADWAGRLHLKLPRFKQIGDDVMVTGLLD